MRRILLSLGLIISVSTFGQVIAPNDTFICQGGPLTLTANYLGGGGASNYNDSIIPYFWESATLSNSYNGPDDQHSGIVNIGFDFCFYGSTYSQLVVSTNNYITFDLTYANNFSNWVTSAVPNANEPLAAIMGPWLDINPATGGTVTYGTLGTAPFRKFVASFNNVPMFSCTSLLYKGQIVIYETTNIIETHIENLPLCASWNSGNSVHGLQNETGSQAYTVTGRNNTPYSLINEGRRFYGAGNTSVIWYDENLMVLDTGISVNVNPTQSATYYVGLDCGGIQDTVNVIIGSIGAAFTIQDESCFSSNDGLATVSLPNNNGLWDLTWTNIFGAVLQTDSNTSGNVSLGGLDAGAYFVEMYDQVNDCSVVDTLYINQPPPIVLNEQVTNAYCDNENGSILLALSGGYGDLTFSWLDGTSELNRVDLMPGDYTIVVSDSIGCDTTVTFSIINEFPATADFTVNPNTGLAPLEISTNNLSSGATSYVWNFGNGDSSVEESPDYVYTENGLYELTLVALDSVSGCSDTMTVLIDVSSDPRVAMPNVFTPGGAYPYYNAITANDSTSNIAEFTGVIYNRWGKKVYEWTDWSANSSGWDGSVGGAKASEGVYYYTVKAVGNNEKVIEKSGHLTLFRND